MIIDPQHKTAFAGYTKPLQRLEKSLAGAGSPVQFYLHATPMNTKLVEILRSRRRLGIICIEGGSPAQAVKDVAAAVKR